MRQVWWRLSGPRLLGFYVAGGLLDGQRAEEELHIGVLDKDPCGLKVLVQ